MEETKKLKRSKRACAEALHKRKRTTGQCMTSGCSIAGEGSSCAQSPSVAQVCSRFIFRLCSVDLALANVLDPLLHAFVSEQQGNRVEIGSETLFILKFVNGGVARA
jgi:hypothetical protein